MQTPRFGVEIRREWQVILASMVGISGSYQAGLMCAGMALGGAGLLLLTFGCFPLHFDQRQ